MIMKKTILFLMLGAFGLLTMQAQDTESGVTGKGDNVQGRNFKLGIGGGVPVGDASDFFSVNINADFTYLFDVSDQIKLGPTVSVFHHFGIRDEFDFTDFTDIDVILNPDFMIVDQEDVTYIPIGGAARFEVAKNFILGVDLGYGIEISDVTESGGGFFFKPQAIVELSEVVGLKAFYSGFSIDGENLGSIGLGIEFSIR